MDSDVINNYFDSFIPRAIWLADWMDVLHEEKFIWTTQPWVVSLFLDCPSGMGLHCPNGTAVSEFRRVAAKGRITWHAMPFNLQYEVADAGLLRAGVDIAHALDDMFNQSRKITASLRDVPGLTRAAVPILAGKGVRAVSVGVNGGSAPPGTPKNTPFIWRDVASGKQLLAFWHPGGYGGISKSECVSAPGSAHVLCTYWRSDNWGPPDSTLEVMRTFSQVRAEFPDADVFTSTLDEYVAAVLAEADALQLPVITDEIGDSWVYGVQSDPLKISDYRSVLRARTACVRDLTCDSQSPAFANFSRLLLKIPEHTWGLDVKSYLGNLTTWSNTYLHACLQHPTSDDCPGYDRMMLAWERQYAYIEWALQALPQAHPVRHAHSGDLQHRARLLQQLRTPGGLGRRVPRRPGGGSSSSGGGGRGGGNSGLLLGGQGAATAPLVFESHAWAINVDPVTGALTKVARRLPGGAEGTNWAGGELAAFGQIVYNVYTSDDYRMIWDLYSYQYPDLSPWFIMDFGKWQLNNTWNQEVEVVPRLVDVYQADASDGSLTLHLQHAFPDWLVREAGAPPAMWTVLHSPPGSSRLHLTVLWQDKTATRLPEALWVRFRPDARKVEPGSWRLHKLGSKISPLEVMYNGSRSMHAVDDDGVSVLSASGTEALRISSLDACLVSPGHQIPFPQVQLPPDMEQGVSFNLVNNIWGTNYIMWVPYHSSGRDKDMAFRFVLEASSLEAGSLEARDPMPTVESV